MKIGIAPTSPPSGVVKLLASVRRSSGLLVFVLALVPTLLAFVVQLALWSLISPYVWFLFFPAVFISSWIGGLRGAVPATVLSAGLVWWFFVPPVQVLLKPELKALFPLVTFLVMGVVFGRFHERLRLANWRAVQALTRTSTANETLRAAVDSLLDPYVLVDAVRDQAGRIVDFVYTDANPAAGVHYRRDRQDLIGARLLDLHHGQAGTNLSDSFRRVIETGEPFVLDDAVFDHAPQGGIERHVDVRAARVGDGLSYTWRDVTERHEAEERRQRFLSHVSHELRSPLAVVHQFGSLLADGVGGPVTDDQQEFLTIMMRNVRQLKVMIDDLLEVTRAQSGKRAIDCRTFALGDLLAESIGAEHFAATEREVTLLLEPCDLPPVFADPERILEVLTNLLENALKFTPAGGQITVAAVPRDADVRVSVQDTGRGISPENQDHIFEQFFQVDHDAQESRSGLGLGLFLCRDLIERQGGHIWVSGDLGAGTTMTFTVPVDVHHTQRVPVVAG
jgi:signal transduction histidine kinase